jgi:hypothetical protein
MGKFVYAHMSDHAMMFLYVPLLVSASFQLVGFMLTYLLHTTHAGKVNSIFIILVNWSSLLLFRMELLLVSGFL